jgi:transcriptional regulator with XRE-family HTH domain
VSVEPLPSEPAEPSLNDSVGRHLRRVRQRRGMTLAAVAAEARMSESFLSQLERGLTGASLDTLARLAQALGIKIADLLEPDLARDPILLRKDERPLMHSWQLGTKELLTPKWAEHLEVCTCKLEPGGSTGEEAYTHGDSEELFLLLRGTVEIELGERVLRLAPGDSVTYRSSMPHRVVNCGDELAEGLWVISPPSF